jgi:hypothetical protein
MTVSSLCISFDRCFEAPGRLSVGARRGDVWSSEFPIAPTRHTHLAIWKPAAALRDQLRKLSFRRFAFLLFLNVERFELARADAGGSRYYQKAMSPPNTLSMDANHGTLEASATQKIEQHIGSRQKQKQVSAHGPEAERCSTMKAEIP